MANITGSVSTNSSKYSYYITWSESAIDSTTNTSLVTATVYVKKISDYSAEGYGGTHHLYINGIHFSDNNYIDMNPETTARVVVSGSTTITHNTDGSKSITISSNGDLPDGGGYGPYSGSASGTAVLAVIPRGAVITSASLNFTVGNTIPVTFTNPANYYVKAFLLAPDASEVSATAFGQVTNGTIPATTGMYAKITTALTGTCTVRLKTYSDAGYTTQIGVDSDKTCTATIDSATNRPTFTVNPTLSSVAKTVYVTDSYNDVPSYTTIATLTNSISTVAIRYYSAMKATISTQAVGKNSATIARYTYENLPLSNYVTYTGSAVDVTVDPVASSVNTITALDSRGLTTSLTPTFSVFSTYSPISSLNWALTVKRASNVGAITTVTLTGAYWQKYFDVNNTAGGAGAATLNSITGQYRYKESTATDWSVNGGAITVTIAAPGRFNKTAHGLVTGDQVWFTTTGALPTGLVQNTKYFVIKDTDDYFWVATTYILAVAGTKVTTTGSQSGVHTMFSYVKWNTLTLTNPTNGTFAHNAAVNGDLGVSGFTTTKAFDVQIRIYDKLSVAIVEKRLSVGKPAIHVSKYGIAINAMHSGSGGSALEVDGVIEQSGVTIDQIVKNKTLLGICSTQLDKTSSTSQSAVVGMEVTVEAGATYQLEAVYHTTSNVAGGIRTSFSVTSATVTAFLSNAITHEGTTIAANTRQATYNGITGGATAVSAATVIIRGCVTFSVAGTFKATMSQNVSDANTSSVLVGSYLKLTKVT